MNELRLILIIIGILLLIGIYWIGRREEQLANNNLSNKHNVPQNNFQKAETSITRVDHKDNLQDDNDVLSSTPLNIESMDDDDHNYLQHDEGDWQLDNYSSESLQLDSEITKPSKAGTKFASLWKSVVETDTPAGTETGIFCNTTSETRQVMELPSGIEPLIVSLTLVNPLERNFEPHHLKQSLEDTGLVYGDLQIYHYYRKPNIESGINPSQKLFSVANMVKPGCFDPQQIDSYSTPGLTIFTQLPAAIDGIIVVEQMLQLGEKLSKRLRGVLCDEKHNKLTQQTIMHIKDQVSEYNLKLQTKLKRSLH